MKNLWKSNVSRWTLSLAIAGSSLGPWVWSRVANGDPVAAPPAEKSFDDLLATYDHHCTKLKEQISTPEELCDPAERAAVAPKVVPIYHDLLNDLDAMLAASPERKDEIVGARCEYLGMLSLLDDKNAAAALEQLRVSKDPSEAALGSSGQIMVQWLRAKGDTAAQQTLFGRITALAKADPASVPVTNCLLELSVLTSPGEEMAEKLHAVVADTMKNSLADQYRQQTAGERQMADALEKKPMVISGKTVDDKDLSTSAWTGKVILVDFWATWCGPCLAEMPRVKQMYADYHGKGLEVLGVSNDQSGDDLAAFLAKHPDMPWPQLFDKSAGENWNPITVGYGIKGIPTMFLIDKKGICRSVTARDKLETLIPKLLAE